MARKELTVTIETAGRDQGKQFHLIEMPAAQAEEWGMRAILALSRGGMELPDNFEFNGIVGLIGLALRDMLPSLQWADAKPLLDEMMRCVKAIPTPSEPHIKRALVDSDIEEISTRLELRLAVWELHTDFLKAG